MKALILTLSIAGCTLAAKAQQLQLSPNKKMLPETKMPQWQKSFNDSLQLNRPKSSKFTARMPSKTKTPGHGGHMPVVVLQNTDHKMPVVKTDRTGYKMPVIGKNDSTANIIATPDDRKKPR